MKTGTITITFLHYWHCGTGQGGSGDLDLVPETEDCGLPLVKGKALKGRLKQTGRELGYSQIQIGQLFGQEKGRYGKEAGVLELTNATMEDDFADVCRNFYTELRHPAPQVAALFEDIASTATENGVAKAGTLRRVRYAVPVKLKATWALHQDALLEDLRACATGLNAIGHGKRDGYGWCKTEFSIDGDPTHQEPVPTSPEITAFDLDLDLLDDVVLSATSATEGGHRTLDYAPGSTLLGAAAKVLFVNLGEHDGALALARGDISFGNAYVVTGDGRSTLPIPLSWHAAKNDDSGTVYNFAVVDWDESPIATRQPVQLRDGYVHLDRNGTMEKPIIRRRQSLRTAITDLLEQYEVAAPGKLFGFESLASGTKLRSRIEVRGEHAEKLRDILQKAFGGVVRNATSGNEGTIIRLGRSKSTEYGRARCRLREASTEGNEVVAQGVVRFLATSDLALLDDKGQPTLQPTPKHFGLPSDWALVESKCYLRTRRFSLWNAKRGGPDLERQVITKGSVIVFEGPGDVTPRDRVGGGQGEGLGRVLVESPLLLADQVQMPKPDEKSAAADKDQPQPVFGHDDFSNWVTERYARKNFDVVSRKISARWVQKWSAVHISVSPSQWSELARQRRGTPSVTNLLARLGTTETADKNTFFGNQSRAKQWLGDPGKPTLAAAVIASLSEEGESAELKLAAFEIATAAMASKQRQASRETKS